jgi:hypothetical protein
MGPQGQRPNVHYSRALHGIKIDEFSLIFKNIYFLDIPRRKNIKPCKAF